MRTVNRSNILRLSGRLLFLFPLVLFTAVPVNLKIGILFLWSLLVVLFLYPAVLVFLAHFNHGRKGRDFYLKMMARAFLTNRISPKAAATYSYVTLREGQLELSSAILDYAEAAALERRNWRKGERTYRHVHSYRALLLWKQNRIDDAVNLLSGLIEEDFKTSIIYANLGWLLIEQGEYEKALAVNLEALEYDRSNAVLDNVGLNYMKLGDLVKSREIYNELIEREPVFPDAWYNCGLLLKKEGNDAEAEKMFQRALDCEFTFLGTVTKDEVEARLAASNMNSHTRE